MRRILSGCVVAGLVCSSASGAFAQSEGLVEEQVINIEDLRIDGQNKKPDLMRAQARDRAKFDRLARIKKSVLIRVVESAEEPAL